MKAGCQKMLRTVKGRDGFTLIEMLIVIIILGILAMIIIPQITVSSEDAKVSTLKTNLSGVRSSIEMYYAQHGNVYPGVKKETDGTTLTASAAEAKTAFEAQMFQYSDATGKTATAYNASTAPFGPYIKSGALPANPFEDVATNTVLLCDVTETDITKAVGVQRVADGTTGYKYMAKLGVIFANDEVSAAAEATKVHKTY